MNINTYHHSALTFAQIKVGEKFVFNGQIYTKLNNQGEFFGICNVLTEKGEKAHLEHNFKVGYLS